MKPSHFFLASSKLKEGAVVLLEVEVELETQVVEGVALVVSQKGLVEEEVMFQHSRHLKGNCPS